nr:hypothetical protein [Lientehia hominis]
MQVAYYYRTTHRDYGYEKYVEPGREAFCRRYGKRTVEEHFFWDEASDVDTNRKAFRQFFKFMKACDKAGVPVVCINENGDTGKQHECMTRFVKEYFGREKVFEDTDVKTGTE